MLSHGVDKWYKMQCGSGIPGIRLGMEKHFVVEELQTRMMKEDLPEAHEMGAFIQGNVWDLLATLHMPPIGAPLKIVVLEKEAREVGPGDLTLHCRAEGPTVQNA